MKFCIRVRLKPSNDRCEFELDQARSKNYIAENSVALGYETHNKKAIIFQTVGVCELIKGQQANGPKLVYVGWELGGFWDFLVP